MLDIDRIIKAKTDVINVFHQIDDLEGEMGLVLVSPLKSTNILDKILILLITANLMDMHMHWSSNIFSPVGEEKR